jgi:hypothetical protein
VGMLSALFGRSRKRRYFARAEYWVYLPGEDMPEQDKILDRVLRSNPYRQGSRMPITPGEAVLFSDVRLHIALALRKRNPHAFRPDLFESSVEPTAESLEILAASNSFVKLRYISEERLADKRHLQFLLHAADAVAELGSGTLIYDAVEERLIPRAELTQTLSEHLDVTSPGFHARSVWRASPTGGVAETRGLMKIGLPELISEELEADTQVLARGIFDEAIEAVWPTAELPESLELVCFEDHYRLVLDIPSRGPAKATILKLPPGLVEDEPISP